ncbi:MAG: hypothetical protein IKW39_04710 [Alphaproteobacteria bacterium]|nr:hypothetical protein [Alphaproteobacteria bacterium]
MGDFGIEKMCYDMVVASMFKNKAVRINFDTPYLLNSGIESPLYIEAGALLSDFGVRGTVVSSLLFWVNDHCRKLNTTVDAIVGIAQGGIVWASSIANNKGLPLLYAFAKPKDHGLFNQIVGDIPFNGARVIVIDDAITTGYSALEVVKALRIGKDGKKANVIGVYSIFDWGFSQVNEKFVELGIEKQSLVSVDTLIDYGAKNNYLKPKEVDKLSVFIPKF